MRKRQAQLYGVSLAVENTGIAVPAFIRALDFRNSVDFGAMAENLQRAYIGTYAAANAFFFIDNWGHIFLLFENTVRNAA